MYKRMRMHYVYVLQNEKTGKYYFGETVNLRRRISGHKSGNCTTTRNKGLWHLVWYAAFRSEDKAKKFEKHLKSGAGHAFSRKRLL